MTGGASSPRWSAGQSAAGLPGVQMGQGCRSQVLVAGQVRVAVVGDFLLVPGQDRALLQAAAAARWVELTRCPARTG